MSRDVTSERIAREADAAKSLLAAIASDDEALNQDMVEGETSLIESLQVALAEIDECDVMVAGLKAKEAEFASRRARAERRIETLRSAIEQAMVFCDMATIKTTTATLTVRRTPPKLLIADEAKIPTQFWRPGEPKLDKAAVKALLDLGEPVEGATLTNGGISLQIRRA